MEYGDMREPHLGGVEKPRYVHSMIAGAWQALP